jgi:hypothetical protein
MADVSDKHPADALNLALSRASGILASLGNCYNTADGFFAVPPAFIAQSLVAINEFVVEASQALVHMHELCDLSIPAGFDTVVEDAEKPVDFGSVLKLRQQDLARGDGAVAGFVDVPAQTYDELLQKVTAAEVFAQAQSQSLGNPDDMLLPILSSLREELLRIRAA